MRTVTKTAVANLKQNKGRNILTGIAIVLTTILIFSILTIGFGTIKLQKEAINEIYPTWHIMYRDVSESNVDAFRQHGSIEEIGERIDVAQTEVEDATIILSNFDDMGYELNKIELLAGDFPVAPNEITVSQETLEELGVKGEIGDYIQFSYQIYESEGMSLEKNGQFKICGILPDYESRNKDKIYQIMVSQAFVNQQLPVEERSYRVMYRMADADGMTTDEIIERGKEIATDFGIANGNVVENQDYLWANYVDPSFITGIAIIILVVILAGILTIYSIYYVSMVHKVQEYGKLKALGATKKQIRQMVFREGMFVCCIAIPVGIILGMMISRISFTYFTQSFSEVNTVNQVIIELLEGGKTSLLQPWIIAITIVISFVTVALSLVKPMRTVGKISPIEAMRYENQSRSNQLTRDGHINLTLFGLTKANLSRNKKRTAITVITLGATGILYMIVATVLTCAEPIEMAKEDILWDYRITINSQSENQEHPERDWKNIQQNNPLNDVLEQQIYEIDGVQKMQKIQMAYMQLDNFTYEEDLWSSTIIGLDEEFTEILEDKQTQGSITYEELMKGEKILLSEAFLHWFPETKVGDIVQVSIENGNEIVKKEFEIGAIGDYSFAITQGSDFILPSGVLEDICDNEITYRYEIAVDNKVDEIEEELQTLVDQEDYLILDSYQDKVKLWEDAMDMMSKMGYSFMIILAGIGIMNLINTMTNSVYTRKRELGIMQAIGLADSQLIRMLQLEGLFYTVGTLILSLGIGNLAGYGVYIYAKSNNLMNITNYHYPWLQTILLILTVLMIQMILSVLISSGFKKQSLIERVRFSE